MGDGDNRRGLNPLIEARTTTRESGQALAANHDA